MTPLADRAVPGIGERIRLRSGLAGRPPGIAFAIVIVGLGLLGADLFGVIHIVGGSLRGNGRAAAFGVELAAATTALLAALAWTVRRTANRR